MDLRFDHRLSVRYRSLFRLASIVAEQAMVWSRGAAAGLAAAIFVEAFSIWGEAS